MERIFLFIYHYRAFFSFLLFELFCAWLIIENNQYQGSRYFNSANSFVASVNGFSKNLNDYFSLREVNQMLAEENTMLREQLEQRVQTALLPDTTGGKLDSVVINRFDFISAKVVNNSVDRFTNFITINVGRTHGIESGMAVISPMGAVGKVKVASPHFSVVISLLNIDLMVSGVMKHTGHFGSIQWDGVDSEYTNFQFIPRHVNPIVGDTIVTSGYSGVFPEGIVVGTIAEVTLPKGAPFYDIRVKLAQDFRKLSYVSVVKSNLLHELDSLEKQIPDMTR
jgi:rod shape-determining protein MreC